ncbi:carotenoid biosynthesis protein [Psychroflexus aestuariivivens]|uniref:carotenoid biosynthesis protein n=1 Tax=Psychroflexus aestuariivivens TaxID=1795040 RepID=UPI000FDC9B3B|nr:carotenoid biosynthesis protein [Psychroflexus aestuariivivens]
MKTNLKVTSLFIILLWLFHISGIIGISLGYLDWFASKTSLNLIIILLSVVFCFDLFSLKKSIIFISIAILGFIVEALGVNYGWFFGDYSYGENLGVKISGVPILIGINWAVLTFICAQISHFFKINWLIKVFIGTILMLILDFLMEFNAPRFGFWEFENSSVPLSNYIAWFGFALLFNFIFHSAKLEGNLKISSHIYIVQFIFFTYFYVFYQI